MPLNTGDRYKPGSLRRLVVTPDGATIKRAESENAFARSYGFKSDYDYRRQTAKAKEDGLFARKPFKSGESEAKKAGTKPEQFRAVAIRLHTAEKNSKGKPLDVSPTGPLRKYLVAIGRSDASVDYAVGATPTV